MSDSESSKYSDSSSDSDTESEPERYYKKGGYHHVKIGEEFSEKYIVTEKLGWGYYSTVWKVKNKENNNTYALKVVKSSSDYADLVKMK